VSEITEVRVPREIVNDDFVTIVDWKVKTGQKVSKGDVLAIIETSKSVLGVEAECEGVVEVIEIEQAEVGVGQLIATIASEAGFQQKNSERVERPVAEAKNDHSPSIEILISDSARLLVEQNDIPLDVFAGAGMVREADVLKYMGETNQEEISEAVLEKHDKFDIESELQGQSLLADARASARERGKSIPWLVVNYFWRNWFLGNIVRWTPRFFTLTIHRWRGVAVGRGSFIDPSAIIETAFPENIIIGDDVRIAASVVIMTHIKPPHYLRQTGLVESRTKSVVLEDHCFIGASAVLSPGVVVGRAAVVANGAIVVNNVPPYTMVSGNPAAVVKRFTPP